MIDESRQENACLYVLGCMSPEDTAAFEQSLNADGELRALVSDLRTATSLLPESLAPVQPRPELKRSIFDELDRREGKGSVARSSNVVPMTKDAPVPPETDKPQPVIGWFGWFGWLAAACLVFGMTYIFHSHTDIESKLQTAQKERDGALREREFAELKVRELESQVAVLTKGNLKGLQLIRLGKPENADPVAMALWDQQKQTGTLLLDHLPAPPAGKDYQLWIIDPNQKNPIDCGVVAVNGNGVVTAEFSAKAKVGGVAKFAITLEQKGGVPSPTLTAMILIGG